MSKITEQLQTTVSDQCDVLVCGGGYGGIAAALAAARCGKKVILLERGYMLGGLGTAGLITAYLPICDGMGHQVSFGIAEELLRLSVAMGGSYSSNWMDSDDVSKRTEKDKRFVTNYNPNIFAILVEQLLLKEGVEILYGTMAVAVDKEEDKINAVIIENKSGRQAILVGSVVDATGDADIAVFAGVPTDLFQQGNLLAAWYYRSDDDGYRLSALGFADVPDKYKTKPDDVEKFLYPKRFGCVEGKELSEMMQLTHNAILQDIIKRREEKPEVWPATLPTIPQVRMTRKIIGDYILDDEEVHKVFDDSVGMVSDWRERGPVFEVPFRTLYSSKVKNLITAGRCTSVTEAMWDVMRSIPCCSVTGEAAGTAAAMTTDFTTLDVKKLQEKLVKAGVVLHENW